MRKRMIYNFLYLSNRTMEFIIFLFFLLTISIGGYVLWDNQQIYQHADASLYENYRPAETTKAGFEELQLRNPEIRGWIRIDGTEIDYPIVQGEDNYKYMNKDAVGKDSLSGSIFMDYRNASDFSDENIILYGHHMAKDMMFGELDKYCDKSFFKTHQKGELYDGTTWHEITFQAFLRANAYDPVLYDPTLKTVGGIQQFAQMLAKQAMYCEKTFMENTKSVITLSTCTSDGTTNGRYVLVGSITS